MSEYKKEKNIAELYLPTRHSVNPAFRGPQQGFHLTRTLARLRVHSSMLHLCVTQRLHKLGRKEPSLSFTGESSLPLKQ